MTSSTETGARPKPAAPPSVESAPEAEIPAQTYRGTGGKAIRVTANFIRLKVDEGLGVYDHMVSSFYRFCSAYYRLFYIITWYLRCGKIFLEFLVFA